MRYRGICLSAALVAALIPACGDNSPSGPSPIGGDTDIPLNQVGNTIPTSSILFDGAFVDVDGMLTVTTSQDGLVTLRAQADLNDSPELLAAVQDWLPELEDLGGWGDATITAGVVAADFRLRVTSEGIQDYFNGDNRPHTLVDYGAQVGDVYRLTLDGGTTLTRRVTAVSTTDDFPYGLLMIKTITVEQDSRIPGVSKFIYRANHRFGLVYVEAVLDDGSSISYYLFPTNS